MKKRNGLLPIIPIAAALLLQLGCSGSDEPSGPQPTDTCPAENMIAGECAGAPAGPLCAGATCTEGAECASVITVADDAALQAAIAGAQPGTCIALEDGVYGNALLPYGVSLLGRGRSHATVGRIEAQGTASTIIKGVTSTGGGVRIVGSGSSVRIEAVRIESSVGDGLLVDPGASVHVERSEIVASDRYGVSAFDATSVEMSRSIVSGSRGPGVWAECTDGCVCVAPKVILGMSKVIVRDNKIVGVSLVGAEATLTNVDVTEHGVTDDTFAGGAGMSVSGCSVLTAKATRVLDNTSFGMLVDDSSATLGGSGGADGVEISRNQLGLWAQNIGQSGGGQMVIEGCKFLANSGVGMGFDGSSKGIIIYGTEVRDTSVEVIPVLVGGVSADAEAVGDGVSWLGASQITIDGLTLGGSARQSMLIDGPVASGSSIANVLLEQGDESKGLLQQNLPAQGEQPAIGQGAPPLLVDMGELFAVPESPMVPSGI